MTDNADTTALDLCGAHDDAGPLDLEALRSARPPGWEHLLFAEVLRIGRDDCELSWRDHMLALSSHEYQKIDASDAHRAVSDAFGELSWLLEPMRRVFDSQEDAFGPPGAPGNALLIEHFATWIIRLYRTIMTWASYLRSLDAGEDYKRAFALAAHIADEPLQQIRTFIDETQEFSRRIPVHLSLPEEKREENPLAMTITLSLSLDEALTDEVMAEVRAAFMFYGDDE